MESNGTALSRKERIRAERQVARDAALQAKVESARNVNKGDSPFAVTMEGNTAEVAGGRDVTFNRVSVTINGKTLFKDTNVRFSAGCRYGLMGPNGRGKSTLLRLLETRELPVQANLDALLVEQEQEYHGCNLTAVQAVLQSHKKKQLCEQEVQELRGKEELSQDELERLNYLEDELNYMGASQAESNVRRILFGLGFPTDWHDRPTTSFSGGWRKRIALACAVFIEPDLLMLDEPTNHLDLNAVIWLEYYLQSRYSTELPERRRKILILVSHDAGFLDHVCTHMVHIENFRLNYFRGSYADFFRQMEQFHAEFDKKYEEVRKRIAAKRQELSKKQLEDWTKEEVRAGHIDEQYLTKRREYVVDFPFKDPAALRDGCLVKLENVAFGYPNCPELFRDVNMALWTDSRITLCGPNGIGKSTLLNLMTGVLTPTEGSVTTNRQLRIGRYNQHFVDKLPLEKTPVEVLLDLKTPEPIKEEFAARALLGSFGLEGICHKSQIATLSGGQKARVAFAVISAECPHFLLLDEPTNHLDVEAIEALVAAIKRFKGGVLCVTHDSRLITETDMNIWVAENHTVHQFPGTLEDYRAYIARLTEQEEEKREQEKFKSRQEKVEKKITEEEKEQILQEARKKNEETMRLAMARISKKKAINTKKEAKKAKMMAEAAKEDIKV